jgi:CPA1 family monovalent cation:H+ antiporter
MPGRDLMLVTAFAVILATVVLQGMSLGWLINRVRPVDEDPAAEMNLPASEAAIAHAKRKAVEVHAYASDGSLIHPQLLEHYTKRSETTQRYAEDTDAFKEGFQAHFGVMLAATAAGRAELLRLHRAGLIEDEVLHELERDLDVEELGLILQRSD